MSKPAVTVPVVPGTAHESRNEVLERELEATVAEALASPRRYSLDKLLGPSTDEVVTARSARWFLKTSGYRCDGFGCEHVFLDGEVVHRRRRSTAPGEWRLQGYCEKCVQEWHPGWWRNRRTAATCEGGCGALVSHWQSWQPTTTCSERCTKRAAAERRRVQHEQRLCDNCSARFTPRRADARYCSNACRQDAYRRRRCATTARQSAPAGSGS